MEALLLLLRTVGLVSAALVFVVVFQVYRAYRFTERSYLLNFFSGFLLIGFSYFLEEFGLQATSSLGLSEGIEWPFLILQLIGISLIASSYFFGQVEETDSMKNRAEIIALVSLLLTAVISIPLILWLLAPVLSVEEVDQYFFLMNALLSLYVFVKGLWFRLVRYRPVHLAYLGY